MWNKMKELYLKYKELILYVIFGGGTTVVDFVVFWLLQRFFGEELYLVWSVIAWVFAVLFAFVTNKIFVFEDKESSAAGVLEQFLKFTASRLFSFGVQEVLHVLLVEVFSVDAFIAKFPIAVIVVILNYILSKVAVFRKK